MRISDWSSDVCSSDLMSDSATAAEGDAAEAGADIGSIDYRVEPPSPGGHIFLFQETEHPEGGIPRTIAFRDVTVVPRGYEERSEEHTSELQSLMRISYAVFCLKKKINQNHIQQRETYNH